MTMPRTLLAVTLTVSISLACAAQLHAQRSTCGPTRRPKELPTVSALMDSSSAFTELEAAKVLRDSMQFTLLMVPGDSIPVVHALDSTDAMAAAVLARSVWPEKPADLWAVRVQVTGGATPALTVSRATYCPPVLTPASGQPVQMLVGVVREQRLTASRSGAPVVPSPPPRLHNVFEIEITERGDVSNVKRITSSGYDAFDQAIARQLAQNKYEPALLDGIPVPAVYRTDNSGPRP